MRRNREEKILLIGGRSKAKSLAASLLSQGYHVIAVNDSEEECKRLAEMKGLSVYNGDGTKPYVLDEAGAAECKIAIALTSCDEDNLVACQICKRNFGVAKTVSLVADPNKTEFFRQMGIDSVVCAISAVTNIIQQQAFIDDLVNIVPVGLGKVQIIEVHIPEDAPVSEKKLWEIDLPQEVVIGCILRGDDTLIPRGDTCINVGDTLVVISRSGQEEETIRVLTGRV